MKRNLVRNIVSIIVLITAAVVIWRLGGARSVTYQFETNRNRGQAFIEQGSWGEAVAALEVSMLLMREIGPSDPRYIDTLTTMADAYEAIGRYQDAYSLRMELLGHNRERYGVGSVEAARGMDELARLQRRMRQPQVAVGALKQSIVMWTDARGENHPDMVPTVINLAEALAESEQFEESGQHYEWAIGILRHSHGNSHPSLAPIELAYSRILRRLGKDELADDYARHAAEIAAPQ